VNREYVNAWRFLTDLAADIGVNRYEFIQALLSGQDPLTAAYETAELPVRKHRAARDHDTLRIGAVRKISEQEEVMGLGTPEKMWETFIRQRDVIRRMCQEHPTLIYFLHKPQVKRRGG